MKQEGEVNDFFEVSSDIDKEINIYEMYKYKYDTDECLVEESGDEAIEFEAISVGISRICHIR